MLLTHLKGAEIKSFSFFVSTVCVLPVSLPKSQTGCKLLAADVTSRR